MNEKSLLEQWIDEIKLMREENRKSQDFHIWGTGYHVKDNRNFEQPIGQNLLGKALMQVRNELKN